MSLRDLEATCAHLAALGRLDAELRPAEEQPGGPSRSALLRIDTAKHAPANVGGGRIGWVGYFNAAGSGAIADLNAILSLVAEAITDIGVVAATVRNAYEEKRIAERRQREAEERLRVTLTGKGPSTVLGEVLVRLDAEGRAWLLDPAKQESGFGFRFVSLEALWRAHPELRPVRWSDDGLIVAPMAMGAGAEGGEASLRGGTP